MRSTQLLTVLALLATSVSSMSIGLLPQDMPHRRRASAEVQKSVLQARGARQFNPEHMGLSGRANPAPRRVRKRGVNQRRCAARSSTTSLAPASTEPAAPTSNPEPEPTTSAEPTPSPEPTTTKTKTKAATKTSTTAEPEPTTDNGGSGSGSGSGGSNTGEGTFYDPALGACGITNTNADKICAVSHLLFDGFEGYTGSDPNSNPICGRKIRATYKGKSVVVTVTDRCVGCQLNDLDFSRGAFDQLADQSLGRLTGVTWSFI